MAEAKHQDEARQDAAQAGLPPDVHDPALLDAYQNLPPIAEPKPPAEAASAKK